MSSSRCRALVAALVAALALVGGCRDAAPTPALAPAATAPAPAADDGAASLPGLARLADDERATVLATVRLIERGGPFPFPRNDGVVFENRERRLPQAPRGTYHEYTVPPPDGRGRGARRLVTGAPPDLWYTRDHYRTFIRLRP
ncbi:MAG: ribonuclease [Deltaproteobacteria bacterium]|nr:ribonuclease [Deltaproteobacteria bacterium]